MMTLVDVLARFDGCLERKPEDVRSMLAPGASADSIETCAREIGKRFPASLRTLYAWHDGERDDGSLFDALCRAKYETIWQGYSEEPLEVRFMSLAEVVRTGDFGGRLDDGARLVPFMWLRPRPALDASAAPEEPNDDDWLLAVDTGKERVWLFEIAEEALEGTHEEAGSLAEWFAAFVGQLARPSFVGGLERAPTPPPPAPVSTKPAVEPPAKVLLRLMVEKELVELAPETTLTDVAARLGPLLDKSPRKRALASALAFFEDDDAIAELYADDDVLRALLDEFV